MFTAHTDTGRAIHVPSTRVISLSTPGINAKKHRRRRECQSVGYPAIVIVRRLFIVQSWTRTQTRTRILSLLLFAPCQPKLVRLDAVTCERSPRRFYASFFRVTVYCTFVVILVAQIIERRVVGLPAIKQRKVIFRRIFPLVISFHANISSFSSTKKNAFVWCSTLRSQRKLGSRNRRINAQPDKRA